MFKTLIPSLLALCPMLVSGDTLIMRDGTRYNGTFISGTSRQIVFADDNTGRQRRLDMRNVQEIAFGDAASTDYNNGNSSDRYRSGNDNTSDYDRLNVLAKLREDMSAAATNANLTRVQRRSLEDSQAVLQTAADDRQAGRTVNLRAVRLALDNIRNLFSSDAFREEDRQVVLNDLDRLRAAGANGNGNNRSVFDPANRSRYQR
jgi:hypothetical protein